MTHSFFNEYTRRGLNGGFRWMLVALVSSMPEKALRRGVLAMVDVFGAEADRVVEEQMSGSLDEEDGYCEHSQDLIDIFLQVSMHAEYRTVDTQDELSEVEAEKIRAALSDEDDDEYGAPITEEEIDAFARFMNSKFDDLEGVLDSEPKTETNTTEEDNNDR